MGYWIIGKTWIFRSYAEIIWAVSVERVLMTLCSSEKLWRLVRNEPLVSGVNADGSSQLLHLVAAVQTSGPAWKGASSGIKLLHP